MTLFSVRAKMYLMEKGVGWKERGGGMLKVNAPKSTVEFDNHGAPDPASFDASALADEDDDRQKHVRLIMRQDHTLRVILNTVIVPAMKFQVTNRLKTSTILFTAFEGGEARQVQMKVGRAARFDLSRETLLTICLAERGQRHGLFATRRDDQEAACRCLGIRHATRPGKHQLHNNNNNRIPNTFPSLSFVIHRPRRPGVISFVEAGYRG